MAQAVSAPTAEAAATRLKRLEGDLILALLAADPDDWGVIGRDAKRDLKRMPSMSYWAALRYGLVTVDHSLDQLLRAAVGSARAGARAPAEPDGEPERHAAFGLDLVAAEGWLPANWKLGVTFELEAKEAEFLRERIMLGTGDSLYKGHAVRKNVAANHASSALDLSARDPWSSMFESAHRETRAAGLDDIAPFWVYPRQGGATIERYVLANPLSRETARLTELQRTLAAYRLTLGQPRQDDLVHYVGDRPDLEWMLQDLSPR